MSTSGTPNTYTGGWRCTCGTWVQNGIMHSCPWNNPPVATDHTWQILEALHDVQKQLERIADALEKAT